MLCSQMLRFSALFAKQVLQDSVENPNCHKYTANNCEATCFYCLKLQLEKHLLPQGLASIHGAPQSIVFRFIVFYRFPVGTNQSQSLRTKSLRLFILTCQSFCCKLNLYFISICAFSPTLMPKVFLLSNSCNESFYY